MLFVSHQQNAREGRGGGGEGGGGGGDGGGDGGNGGGGGGDGGSDGDGGGDGGEGGGKMTSRAFSLGAQWRPTSTSGTMSRFGS